MSSWSSWATRKGRNSGSSNKEEATIVKLSTQTIAAASARHPWRTIGGWLLAVVAGALTGRPEPDFPPAGSIAIEL